MEARIQMGGGAAAAARRTLRPRGSARQTLTAHGPGGAEGGWAALGQAREAGKAQPRGSGARAARRAAAPTTRPPQPWAQRLTWGRGDGAWARRAPRGPVGWRGRENGGDREQRKPRGRQGRAQRAQADVPGMVEGRPRQTLTNAGRIGEEKAGERLYARAVAVAQRSATYRKCRFLGAQASKRPQLSPCKELPLAYIQGGCSTGIRRRWAVKLARRADWQPASVSLLR